MVSVVSVVSVVHDGLSLRNVVPPFLQHPVFHLTELVISCKVMLKIAIMTRHTDVLPALELPRKKLAAPLITVLVLTCVTVFSFGAWPLKHGCDASDVRNVQCVESSTRYS